MMRPRLVRRQTLVVVLFSLLLLVPQVAATAAPTIRGDPQAVSEVTAAFQKFNAARTWRSRMASGGGTTATEYVAPDRFHMTITQGNDKTEIFLIGRQTWVRSSNVCSKPPVALPVLNPKEMMEHGTADTSIAVSRSGPGTVEGTPVQTYALVVDSKGTTVREKLSVATGTGLPRRIEVESDRGPIAIDYFDFNAPITINDPPC